MAGEKHPPIVKGILIAMMLLGGICLVGFLRTGEIRFTGGQHIVDRAQDPYFYWGEMILLLCGIIALPLWLLYRGPRKR